MKPYGSLKFVKLLENPQFFDSELFFPIIRTGGSLILIFFKYSEPMGITKINYLPPTLLLMGRKSQILKVSFVIK
jgi:hypothetical protein